HVLGLMRLEADAFQTRSDHVRTELRRFVVLEAAAAVPERGSYRGNHDRAAHRASLSPHPCPGARTDGGECRQNGSFATTFRTGAPRMSPPVPSRYVGPQRI